MRRAVIDQLPLDRDPITGPSQLAPGVVERTSSGSRRNETNYLLDGANVQAPDTGFASAAISWDAIEEIEFITTTNPMENYVAIGGTLNLVTRTGGNKFHGMGSYYFTNRDLSQILLPKENSDTLGISQPAWRSTSARCRRGSRGRLSRIGCGLSPTAGARSRVGVRTLRFGVRYSFN